MLVVLTILVVAVLLAPISAFEQDLSGTKLTDILDYRKNILAIIITAFGAWVGAGAAYFFGRESLHEASQSLLSMRDISLSERLRHVAVKEIPPRPIDWFVKVNDPLKETCDKLKSEVDRWFVPVVDEKGALVTVIHEEAIWRFLMDQMEKTIKKEDIWGQPISKLLDYIDESKKNNPRFKALRDVSVSIAPDKSASDANQLMQEKEVYLAIVIDENRKPIGYVTTGDVRRILMKVGVGT